MRVRSLFATDLRLNTGSKPYLQSAFRPGYKLDGGTNLFSSRYDFVTFFHPLRPKNGDTGPF